MELDQLYKKLARPYAERLSFLEKHPKQVELRDDLYLERITLYNQLEQYSKAKELITTRKFHPWEGGEGKVTGQYVLCYIELANIAIAEKRFIDALELLKATDSYPHNLGEGKLYGAQENDINYFKGCAFEGLADMQTAPKGVDEPAQAFFYNDQQPDKIFYQGLAHRKLGNETAARSRFCKLITYGEMHLFDTVKIDFFAVSLPDLLIWDDDLQRRNQIHCNYLMGLGHMGMGNNAKALDYLQKTFDMDINHFGVQMHLKIVKSGSVAI
jgi:tetratricopeptide (TPR) repeat protein